MVGEWIETTVGEAFEIGPSRTLKRGAIAPFIPMDALPVHARSFERIDSREFTGSGTRFKNGDTLIARITPCLENGKTAYVAGLPANSIGHGSTEYIVLAGRESLSDDLYGYYLARSPDFRRYAIGHMEGTSGRQRVPSTAIEKYELALPPLTEQRAIAHILGTLDDKIELNRRRNQTLEAMVRALFKAWFVDFEPVRAKMEGRWQRGQSLPGLPAHLYDLFPDRLVESELGEIPEGWRVGPVYEIASVRYGAPFASSKFNSEGKGQLLVRIRDLRNERPGVWTEEVHPKGYLIQPGDIVVGMDGEFRAYLWGGEPAWMNQRICVFHPNNPHCAAFVRNAIEPHLARVEATEVATTVIHLGKGDIDEFQIVIPGDDVAIEFEKLCQPNFDQIVLTKQQSSKLAQLRDTLLPKLISGELRVPEAETFLGERGL